MINKSKRRVKAAPKTPEGARLLPYQRYSPKLATAILDRLAQGERWHRLCREEGMPSYATLYAWRRRHPAFAEGLELAREAAADLKADLALETAENAPSGAPGDKLRIDTLLKHAAVDAPHRWGGKTPPPSAEPAGRLEVVFRARHFERATRPDGTTYIREILPEGESGQ